jgi:hypothetical protein
MNGIGISDNPFCLHQLTLSVGFCKRIGWKGCLPFVKERVNELPVAVPNVNKGGQFSVITTGSPQPALFKNYGITGRHAAPYWRIME